MTREECAALGHVWFNVVPGLDRCVRCDAEVFDLDADPITVDLGDGRGTTATENPSPPESAGGTASAQTTNQEGRDVQ